MPYTGCLPRLCSSGSQMRVQNNLFEAIWPPVPAEVRDDLARVRLDHLRAQVPLLYCTTIAVVVVASFAGHPDAPNTIRILLPTALVLACVIRLLWWLRTSKAPTNPDATRAIILKSTIIASVICLTASVWSTLGWFESLPGQRIYYPVFMVIGGLAAAFCMASIRLATVAMILVGIGPVMVALMLFGNWMDRLAAGIVALASIFLLRMIHQQHAQIVRLLQLQQQMSDLADTDSLTGLPNRRALYAALDKALEDHHHVRIALVDLDNFKPVNDVHGHAVGDKLLTAVADRLRVAAGDSAIAYRLGGDEFAIVAKDDCAKGMQAITAGLLARLAQPLQIDGHRVTIGASVGTALSQARDNADTLINRADTQLYAAKAMHKQSAQMLVAQSA